MFVRYKNLLVIATALLGTMLLIWSGWNTALFVIMSFVMAGVCVYHCKLDVVHPYVCFFPFFVLYTCAYPLMKMAGIDPNVRGVGIDVSPEVIALSWTAIATLALGLLMVKRHRKSVTVNRRKRISRPLAQWGFWGTLAVSLLFYLYILYNGYQSKYDIAANQNILMRIGAMGMNANPIFGVMCVLLTKKKKKQRMFIAVLAINSMMAIGFTGERNIMLTVIFLLLLSYIELYGIARWKIVVFGLISMLILSVSSSLKMFIANDGLTLQRNQPLWVQFLSSDFSSAGFNLNNLVVKKDTWESFRGMTLLYDILSPVDFLFPGLSQYSATRWNQKFFWATSRTGLGFTIIGEGYMNFGLIGVILWMLLISAMMAFLYRRAKNSVLSFVSYAYAMALFVYASRGSLANVISPLCSYMLVIYAANYVVTHIRRRR